MKTLLAKEIRLLLPAFAVALALSTLPVWLTHYDPRYSDPISPSYFFLFGVAMLALSSFGREIGLRTLPFNLAQPVDRARLWWIKILALTVSVFLSFLVLWFSDQLRFLSGHGSLLSAEALVYAELAALAFVAGGLWLTLLLRQVAAAFWLTLLIPPVVAGTITGLGGSGCPASLAFCASTFHCFKAI